MIRVGFTGTQHGATEAQVARLWTLLWELSDGDLHLAHGDCVGADAQAHEVAYRLGARLHLHPPTDEGRRAFCNPDPLGTVAAPLPYIDRNHAIVDSTDVLLALPRTVIHEDCRHGTCATVRYASKLGRPVHVILPDGTVMAWD